MLATAEDKNPNRRFVDNELLVKLAENEELQRELAKRKLNNWRLDSEYVNIIFEELLASDIYKIYMEKPETSFKEDRAFVIEFLARLSLQTKNYMITWKITVLRGWMIFL